jgi:bifunctional DNA-binding transcriptional regulator/antitoxin component of YhaV-PrlF toxin-antitoxin module
MRRDTARLDKSGRLLIPVELRRELGAEPGEELVLRLDEEGLHVSTAAQALARAQGFVRSLDVGERKLSGELIAERRREALEDGR